MTEFFGENHCGCDDWTRQCPAARLVNPGNPRDSDGAEFFFRNEIRTADKTSTEVICRLRRFSQKFFGTADASVKCVDQKNALFAHRRCFLAFASAEII